jgi:hypothetical protein
MSRGLIEITQEALTLPQADQLKLARALLERSEARGEPGIEQIWEDEIERRIQLIDDGLAKGRLFSEVIQSINRPIGR